MTSNSITSGLFHSLVGYRIGRDEKGRSRNVYKQQQIHLSYGPRELWIHNLMKNQQQIRVKLFCLKVTNCSIS